jgi:antitoxin ChpS
MHTSSLRRVGGSIMLAVPPALLDVLRLSAGAEVGLTVENGRLVVQPAPKPKYSLSELLAASDYSGGPTPEDREWADAPSVGRETL